MAKPAKQKPPPYPRPVDIVIAEEIPSSARDVAFYSGKDFQRDKNAGDDSDVEAEQRAAKKRRIEAHATAYLRGEPLYIMSAQLKGPFGEKWRNPWAKKKRVRAAGTKGRARAVEIAETARKAPKEVESTEDRRSVILEAKQRYLNLKSASQEQARASVVPPTSPIMMDLTGPVAMNIPRAVTPPKNGLTKERRIEEWLKTSEAFANYKEDNLQASPTPVGVSNQIGSASKYRKDEIPQVQHDVAGRSLNEAEPSKEPNQDHRHFEQNKNSGPLLNFHPSALQTASELTNDEPRLVVDADSESGARAEHAILKAKRRSLHVVPPRADLSPFEYRKVSIGGASNNPVHHEAGREAGREAPAKSDGQPQNPINQDRGAINDETQDRAVHVVIQEASGQTDPEAQKSHVTTSQANEDQMHILPPEDQQTNSDDKLESTNKQVIANNGKESLINAHPNSRPGLSAATSDLNSTDLLPSAQQPPTLLPAISSGWQDVSPLNPQASPVAQVPSSDIDDSDQIPLDLSLCSHDRVSQSIVNEEDSTPVVERSTQDILAGISPFTFSTTKKKKNSQSTRHKMPTTATKVKKTKERKRASFVHEHFSSLSSHGSIQGAMKAKVGKRLASPPPFSLNKKVKDTDVSDEDEIGPAQRISSSFPGAQKIGSSQLKSILKSSNSGVTLSSLWPSKSGVSALQQHDSQNVVPIESGQNALVHDDPFDLDGAISELGSFLGTWDVDKEASNLVAS